MRKTAALPALAALVCALVAGVGYLLHLRLAQGDVYPPYSTLRSDPLGTRAYFEGLRGLPGLEVSRLFQSGDELAPAPRTIILAGLAFDQLKALTTEDFNALDKAARSGSRVVLLMRSEFLEKPQPADLTEPFWFSPSKKAGGTAKEAPKTRDPPALRGRGIREAGGSREDLERQGKADLKQLWGVAFDRRVQLDHEAGAVLEPAGPPGLPPSLTWPSGIYLTAEKGSPWQVIYRDASRPVLMEMADGMGSVVVGTDSYFVSNEALQKERSSGLLSWIVGANRRIDFDESHLGVVEDVGIAALARRYGLAGAFATLLLLAGLFVWRRMSLFVPPPPAAPAENLSFRPTAALEALLLRSVPADSLMEVCLAEWRKTAGPTENGRVTAAMARAAGTDPASAYNLAVKALRRTRTPFKP